MALTVSQANAFLSGLDILWDDPFFAKTLTIIKQPQQTAVSASSSTYIPGYGITDEAAYTVTQESGSFRALIVPKDPQSFNLEGANKGVDSTIITVKFEQAAKDYINNGVVNEAFIFNGETYNAITPPNTTSYLGRMFYYCDLMKA
jgi:hypothetical protein